MAPPGEEKPAGLCAAVLRVAASLLDIGRTRLELAATEIEEERLRLSRQVASAAAAMLLAFLAALCGSAWAVLWCQPRDRTAVLGGLALLYLCGASAAGWRWMRQRRREPALLQATLDELRRDIDNMRSAAGLEDDR